VNSECGEVSHTEHLKIVRQGREVEKGSNAIGKGIVKNLRVAVGISLIYRFSPDTHRISGLTSAISISGCWQTALLEVMTLNLAWLKMWENS